MDTIELLLSYSCIFDPQLSRARSLIDRLVDALDLGPGDAAALTVAVGAALSHPHNAALGDKLAEHAGITYPMDAVLRIVSLTGRQDCVLDRLARRAEALQEARYRTEHGDPVADTAADLAAHDPITRDELGRRLAGELGVPAHMLGVQCGNTDHPSGPDHPAPPRDWPGLLHNVLAHPLLALWPRLRIPPRWWPWPEPGEWLHAHTDETVTPARARWREDAWGCPDPAPRHWPITIGKAHVLISTSSQVGGAPILDDARSMWGGRHDGPSVAIRRPHRSDRPRHLVHRNPDAPEGQALVVAVASPGLSRRGETPWWFSPGRLASRADRRRRARGEETFVAEVQAVLTDRRREHHLIVPWIGTDGPLKAVPLRPGVVVVGGHDRLMAADRSTRVMAFRAARGWLDEAGFSTVGEDSPTERLLVRRRGATAGPGAQVEKMIEEYPPTDPPPPPPPAAGAAADMEARTRVTPLDEAGTPTGPSIEVRSSLVSITPPTHEADIIMGRVRRTIDDEALRQAAARERAIRDSLGW
jgi:hypothetical protein